MPPKAPKFCPICAAPLAQREEGGRLRPACDVCGYVHYVNPVPGVGILIEMEGGLVLIQRGHPPHQGQWALPSGFVEADESAEEAAIREAEEETGLKVAIIELAAINSFPEGPPVSGIMIFYRVRPVGGTLRAGDDASAARVFAPAELPVLPFRTHREMVATWLEHYAERPADAPRPPTPALQIRPYELRDQDEVLALLQLIPANRGLSEARWHEVAQRLRDQDSIELFVAELREPQALIVGCASLSILRDLTAHIGLIGNMAVLPAYQRRGVGAELLRAILRRASIRDLSSLWVAGNRANDQARAFYAALGFAEIQLLQLRIR